MIYVLIACLLANLTAIIWAARLFAQNTRLRRQLAICGCGHHFAFHDPVTGKCKEYHPKLIVPGSFGKEESPNGKRLQCPCQQYSGVQPPPFYPQLS